ncbi:hypothetical protein COW36_16580 [bacterium (Candidatus Blackallbacteria) CG17_big_fil_post_rev_8_21_14_2_50_48_46]|uniref:DUF3375 domain-containing protein n=1 Tax=bacterium (Candidatus Blackallbacteria) CG17_big_fil_post_rev_8_21_14_2_50_48_46 TaxID=2014261 RepID=A0A2M7G1I6_9BACT|nr:MAG: hypothetical protein COW64_08115 [bacterium (Candidatus Blackallbacteria) CG18_big_fil_WC_8_21_14_2_50_49_26]PIW15564.1 MAG: hypothetical protein COW36_16580 [bacterium (Candidatus Blackallbacteria) CG17_big_fil_post_rev_8_21_14_2_50_48_46]PIW49355.1 MAG: hypothetical protein COW20_06010 [bacterium (Candidatus Blackallbacteria) CG13_big_fil_rev_8_21_14_2_50_49_14]
MDNLNHQVFERFSLLLEDALPLRLLKSDYAPLILATFQSLFKSQNRLILDEESLQEQLAELLEDIRFRAEEGVDRVYEAQARHLLARWTDQGYLRNFLTEEGKVCYELTADSEKALRWVETLEKQDFVGTESRFRDILGKLRELLEYTVEDPDRRVAELERRKAEIEIEIARIRECNEVSSFDDYQIKSRFQELNRLARDLLADFKEVEDNFRQITRTIYQKHAEKQSRKGQILRYAFDAIEELRQSEQGKSFYAFWDSLLRSSGHQELQNLAEELYMVLENRQINTQDSLLRSIKSFLHQAAQKVLESNDRMAEKLSRIIIERDPQETRRLKETIGSIKEVALKLAEKEFSSEAFISIEGQPEIFMPLERKLGRPSIDPVFSQQPEEPSGEFDWQEEPEVMDRLFQTFFVDKKALKKQLARLLQDNRQLSLQDILRDFPIEKGLPELFAYLSFASQAEKHEIDTEKRDLILFDHENQRALVMPEVRFNR